MTRKILKDCIANYTRSKKRPLCKRKLVFSKRKHIWVGASKTYNYMMNDHLVDWFKEHSRREKYNHYGNKKKTFKTFLFSQGNIFEKQIVDELKKKHPVKFVSTNISKTTVAKTKSLMKLGVPIIHSAPVVNWRNKTRGIIDLLVRSDYLSNIVGEHGLSENSLSVKAPKLSGKYHYIVIDVKFSSIPLCADGIHIRNSGSIPAYKTQCLIYTQAVGLIQGYTPQYSFLLGRRYYYNQKGQNTTNSSFEKLAKICYEGFDAKFKQSTRDAIKWVRRNKREGHTWSLNPPSTVELYPNMSRHSGEWQSKKQELAEQLGEISSVWYCGVNQRNLALEKGITSWRDPRCNSEVLGVKGSRSVVIDKMLELNRGSGGLLIRPDRVGSSLYNWRLEGNEIFVDFETIPDVSAVGHSDIVFMIGVYFKDGERWKYKNFTCSDNTMEEEKRIVSEFVLFMSSLQNPKIWFWHAEVNFWNKVCRRHAIASDFEWCDLAKLFKGEPILVKGCFNFGLKTISKMMKQYDMIDTKMESVCCSGVDAIMSALNYYNCKEPTIISDIEKYNSYDCRVMKDILTYLRENK